MRLYRPALSAAALAALVLTLGGCGSSDDSSNASAGTDTSASSTPSSTPSEDGSDDSTDDSSDDSSADATQSTSPSASASATPAGPSRCGVDDVKVSLSGGDSAAGSTYYEVDVTSRADHPCRTGGFGGMSLVDASGKRLGAPAVRSEAAEATAITLQPGERTAATLQVGQADSYDAAKCQPVQAAGLAVIVPNETHAQTVPIDATACRNAKVRLLTLTPYGYQP